MKYILITFICITITILSINCQKGIPYLEFTTVEAYSNDSLSFYFSEPFIAVDTSSQFFFTFNDDSLQIHSIKLTDDQYGIVFKLKNKLTFDSIYEFKYSPLNCKIEGEYLNSINKMSGTGAINFKLKSIDSIPFTEVVE